MSIKDVFAAIQGKLAADPSKVAGLDATFQFNLSGDNGGEYFVVFADGAGTFSEGKTDHPDITIIMDAADFTDLAQGKLDGMGAFMSGKLKVEGDISLAMRLQTMLT